MPPPAHTGERPAAVSVSAATEAIAGITAFLACSYIVVVNPVILTAEGTGMPFSGVLTATVLVCFTMTLLMGLYARLPFVVAPGMGLNAFFAYTLVIGQGVDWRVALGMVFWAGVLFVLLSLTPVRPLVVRAIPDSLRTAMAAGIGLFLTLIGLGHAGLVEPGTVTITQPGALDHRAVIALVGLAVSAYLLRRRSPFALLAGMLAAAGLAWGGGCVSPPARWTSAPDFSSAFVALDAVGALQWTLLPGIVTLLFTDLFDSVATLIGVSQATGLTDDERDERLGQHRAALEPRRQQSQPQDQAACGDEHDAQFGHRRSLDAQGTPFALRMT